MPDAPVSGSVDSTAAAPAAPAQTGTPAAPAVPSPEASKAGKTLAQARAERRAAAIGMRPAQTTTATGDPSSTTVADGKKDDEKPDDQSDTKPDTKRTAGEDDELLARLIAEDRRIKTAAKELEQRAKAIDAREAETAAKAKEIAEDVELAKRVREARTKGDKLAVLRAIAPDEDPSDLFWELAKVYQDKEDGSERTSPPQPQIDPEKLTAEIEQKLEAKRKAAEEAEQKKQAEARAAREAKVSAHDGTLGAGFGAAVMKTVYGADADAVPAEEIETVLDGYSEYAKGAADLFAADKTKYPAIARFGTTPMRVVNELMSQLRATPGQVPPVAKVLKAIEDQIAADIRATPYGRPSEEPPPAKPSTTVTPEWRADAGRPASGQQTEDRKPETLDEIRARRKAEAVKTQQQRSNAR